MAGHLEPGSLVNVRGQRWLLTRAQRFDACTVLTLEGRDRGNAMERAEVIDPFDRPRLISSGSLKRRRRRVVIKRALAAIHEALPAGGLWTAAAARIDLHAYQLEPALAAIGGATRLLLADAVGLGKTIQAGLLLAELLQRGWIERALIVCPAGLRETWRRELDDRFGIAAAILDQQAIAERVAAFPPGINPWLADRIVIVSIDFVKRGEVIAALAGVPVDLLIVDEAHHLAPGTDRGAAVAGVASRSGWCALVSATPHSGDRAAFEYLTGIGELSDDLVVFRRTRRDVGLAQARRTHFLRIRPGPEERDLFQAIELYSRAIWIGRGRDDHAARLIAITMARRASSSAAAIERTLRRRRLLLGTAPADPSDPSQSPLPWEDVDDADGDDGDAILAAQGLGNLDDERAGLERLIELASRCARSESGAKMRRLLRLLSRINEPAIVFTEYRDTLDAIAAAVRGAYRVASIHGAMPRDSRTAIVDAFNRRDFDVLIATDAAGEGLNLQHRCRLVIDFELPWNPLRLEQRIGRVDRLGQHRVAHGIRFFHGGTIEEDVLERLALRRRRAEHDLDRAVTERDVAAAVFTGDNVVGPDLPAMRGTAVASATSELARIANQRRFLECSDAPDRCWTPPRRSDWRRLLVVRRDTFTNAHGVVSGNRHGVNTIALRRRPRSLREWRAVIERSVDSGARPAPDEPSGRIAIRQRMKAVRKQLAREQRREYQRSLFDGRADALQSDRDDAFARLDAALARIELATAPSDPAHTQSEVVAAFSWRRT